MPELTSNSVEETIDLGKRLAKLLQADDVLVLTGDLGAGKTHLTKGIAAGLGVQDPITSPTFPVLLEYQGRELDLLHFDFYRLEAEDQLEDIDWFGLCESGGVSVVEWGDMFPDSLPEDYLLVACTVDTQGVRHILLTGYGERGAELETLASALI